MTQYHTIKRLLIANRGEDHPSADQPLLSRPPVSTRSENDA